MVGGKICDQKEEEREAIRRRNEMPTEILQIIMPALEVGGMTGKAHTSIGRGILFLLKLIIKHVTKHLQPN